MNANFHVQLASLVDVGVRWVEAVLAKNNKVVVDEVAEIMAEHPEELFLLLLEQGLLVLDELVDDC